MSGHCGHIGWQPAEPNTIAKGHHPRPFHQNIDKIGSAVSKELMKIKNSHRLNVKLFSFRYH